MAPAAPGHGPPAGVVLVATAPAQGVAGSAPAWTWVSARARRRSFHHRMISGLFPAAETGVGGVASDGHKLVPSTCSTLSGARWLSEDE